MYSMKQSASIITFTEKFLFSLVNSNYASCWTVLRGGEEEEFFYFCLGRGLEIRKTKLLRTTAEK